ncbi:PREDICTED: serine hydrolase-like protein [Papilio xuthus]|uniref:Serine hydrolase-like protein n=1 Tax=Papilio xuthus TaxID=66420 RepID=A0AAJ6ZKG8_PAPXU|nr:PREDICTED: serine hydrolase-like protein [Papilio xuthus]
MKKIKEWFLNVPWGKVALISWGDPKGESVLLVHGRQDSAATFIPLLELLPDKYHYVGVDMPGTGLSDPLPKGVMLTRIFPVSVVQLVVEHLKWEKFIYIGHSMGTEIGLFYNAVFPRRVKRCIYLDGGPALRRLLINDFSLHFKSHYEYYYDNYESINNDNRVFSKESATKAVMKARNMTKQQAELILSRNLKKIGDDKYKLSWDKREKILAPTFSSIDYYYSLFSQNCPPTLFISANQSDGGYTQAKDLVKQLISDLTKNTNYFKVVAVDGGHDVHFTNPERLAKYIVEFLDEIVRIKAKL